MQITPNDHFFIPYNKELIFDNFFLKKATKCSYDYFDTHDQMFLQENIYIRLKSDLFLEVFKKIDRCENDRHAFLHVISLPFAKVRQSELDAFFISIYPETKLRKPEKQLSLSSFLTVNHLRSLSSIEVVRKVYDVVCFFAIVDHVCPLGMFLRIQVKQKDKHKKMTEDRIFSFLAELSPQKMETTYLDLAITKLSRTCA